ncbi:GNAT family N-acetyltransferase [Micromonospora sp. NPDC051300]|uniref:GNAT family N-acetyltransferase n=1 Tax=Micromonospora sp. NPDC051300 TaxID=3364286 RepID=UPI003794DC67
MAVRAEHDRAVLAALLGRDPVLHAYQLGDLDDFFWPYTSWFRSGDEVVLLYHGVELPTLLAFAAPERVAALSGLLARAAPVLPARLWAHLSPGLEATVARWFTVSESAPHDRMALTDPGRLAAVAPRGEPLGVADLAELRELYAVAYPGNWFDPRMVETGQYVGVRERGRLVAVAGVHVFSPRWRVAAVGNVTTRPDARGRGLAAGAVAALCARLSASVDHITLNVRSDNVAAVRLYGRLGFTRVAGFTECALTRRVPSAAAAG